MSDIYIHVLRNFFHNLYNVLKMLVFILFMIDGLLVHFYSLLLCYSGIAEVYSSEVSNWCLLIV